jgi:hypothetical protein
VVVTLWTHTVRGLSRNDFIIAAKVDRLAEPTGARPPRQHDLAGKGRLVFAMSRWSLRLVMRWAS